MDSFFYRFRNPLVLITVVLLQVIALAMQVQRPSKDAELPASARAMESAGAAPDGKHVSLLRRWTVTAMTPVETAVHGTSLKLRGAWGNYINLREEEASFAEDAQQGRRLQKLLGFKESYVTSTVAAQVIGTSGSERSHVLYLDKGSDDGLKPEQAVITPDGVVGKIRDVFPHTSQLLLISDPSSGAGVLLATGRVEIDNLTADSRIKVGEPVVTSGGDLVFPRGLPVGTIESIEPDPLHQPYTAIRIKTAANLSRLEEVLVITGTSETLPPTAAQDAAAAEATQEANQEATQRAADLIAEKLPSLHPDGAAAGAVGADGKPVSDDPESQVGGAVGFINSGLPRPKPAVHPDKYSPGTVPPAAELTPGAKSPTQTQAQPQPQQNPQ
jgi:rod shape-determining protein MreC